jgi:integrase
MAKRTSGNGRKGLYKRGGRWWCYSDPVEGGRVSTGAKTVEGAQEWLRERERRAANPAYSASHAETLGKWVRRMVADKQQQRSAGTVDFYTKKVGHLLRLFGEGCALSAVNSEAVDRYKDQRFSEGAAHYTISKEFTALRQTLKRAARAGVYANDLSTLFPPEFGHGYTPRETVLPDDIEDQLRLELKPHQWAAVAFVIATSARFGEMRRAQPGDWDRERGTVLIRGTKTAKSHRVIPVVSVMVPYLEAAEPFLPFDFDSLTQQLKRICKRKGWSPITANDLRRTCSTRLIEAGADPYAVTRVTGHTNTKILKKVYDRSRVDAAGEAIEGQIAARTEQRAKRNVRTETAQSAECSINIPEENSENAGISNPLVPCSNQGGRAKTAVNTAGRPEEARRYPDSPGASGTDLAQFPVGLWALAEAANRLGLGRAA